jgi:6-pyruvoyltetrahydropterin/6-carboxytetrahydropterin synthase
MTTIVRKVKFCAGHRLCNHEGKCSSVHGHNYVVHFHVSAEQLDEVGRVIDFAAIKQRLGGWIDQHWDHGFLCYKEDETLRDILSAIPGQKVFIMDVNPTAENLARHLLTVVGPAQLAGTNARLVKVELWETENSRAEVTLD